MYLPSKFTNSKYKIPILILLIVVFYLLCAGPLRYLFVSLSANLALSRNKYLAELDDLKSRNLELAAELEKSKDIALENKRLRGLLGFKEERDLDLMPSRVIAIEPSQFRRIILVEGGVLGGQKEDMLVFDENAYLVGKILRVHSRYSEVAFINDPDFTATVRITDSLGLLRGTLSGAVKVLYIEYNATIAQGDLVKAASFEHDVSFVVGRIKEIRQDKNSLFLDVTVEPLARPYSLRTVFVLK